MSLNLRSVDNNQPIRRSLGSWVGPVGGGVQQTDDGHTALKPQMKKLRVGSRMTSQRSDMQAKDTELRPDPHLPSSLHTAF